MIKRIVWLAVIILSALAFTVGCRQEQLSSIDPMGNADGGIRFETHIGGTTKGVSKDRFVAGDAFEVVGYSADAPFKDGTTGAISMPTTARLIFDQNDEYFPYKRALVCANGIAGDDLAWSYLPMVFWPSEGSVSFTAFSPTASKGNKITANAATVAAVPSLSFEVFGGTKVYDKASLEAARLENVHQVDLLHSMNLDIAAEPAGGVELDFRHALTKVRFSVKGAQDEGVLRIISVTLTGVAHKGTMDLIYNEKDAAKIDYLGGWRALPADTLGFPVVLNSVNSAAVGAGKVVSVVDDHEALLMVPQKLTNVKAHVVYAHSLDGGLTWQEYVSGDGATELSLATSGVPCWKPNMSVHYIMEVNPGLPVLFTAELRSWEYTQDQYVPKFIVSSTAQSLTTIELLAGDVVTTVPASAWVTIEEMAARSRAVGVVTPLDKAYTVPDTKNYGFAVTTNALVAREAKIVITRGSGEVVRTITLDVLQEPLQWAKGNLVADGAGGCKIGAPEDGGLYFQFGSLIGYKGGAPANGGTGVGIPDKNITAAWGGNAWSWSNDAMVYPATLVGTPSSWPQATEGTAHKWYFSGQGVTSGAINATDVPNGVGDPCAYYLGGSWRLPTNAEYGALAAAPANQGPWVTTPAPGRWLGVDPGNASSSIFFLASGFRGYANGLFYSVTTGGYGWSSSVYAATFGLHLDSTSNLAVPQHNSSRSYGFPVRCVSPVS